MLISVAEVTPLFETLLTNPSGAVVVFDAGGNEIYRMGEAGGDVALDAYVQEGGSEDKYVPVSGEEYVLQKVVSDNSG